MNIDLHTSSISQRLEALVTAMDAVRITEATVRETSDAFNHLSDSYRDAFLGAYRHCTEGEAYRFVASYDHTATNAAALAKAAADVAASRAKRNLATALAAARALITK
jgi:hypothetical protein